MMRIVLMVFYVVLLLIGVVGACSIESQAIWKSSMDFTNRLQKCCAKAFMLSTSINSCLRSIVQKRWKFEMEDSCLDCFNDSFGCVKKNCMSPCWKDAGSADCLRCNNEYCNPALKQCTGVDRMEDLPVPPESTR